MKAQVKQATMSEAAKASPPKVIIIKGKPKKKKSKSGARTLTPTIFDFQDLSHTGTSARAEDDLTLWEDKVEDEEEEVESFELPDLGSIEEKEDSLEEQEGGEGGTAMRQRMHIKHYKTKRSRKVPTERTETVTPAYEDRVTSQELTPGSGKAICYQR